jgi:hypothetical protein
VALFDAEAAIDAVRSGMIDASFRTVTMPARQLTVDTVGPNWTPEWAQRPTPPRQSSGNG